MVKIRLMRMGAKKRPFYRVVVADARSPRDGRFLENIGKYHPLQHPSLIEIDEERALHWLRTGAQPSEPVKNLLVKTGVWEKFSGEAPPPEKPAPEAKAEPAAEPTEPAAEPTEPAAEPTETAAEPTETAAEPTETAAEAPAEPTETTPEPTDTASEPTADPEEEAAGGGETAEPETEEAPTSEGSETTEGP